MDQYFFNVKERVLKIVEYKGFTRENFFSKIGLTYSNFTGKAKETSLNSLAIGKILIEIPDVNPDWLLLGRGSMFRNESTGTVSQSGNTAVNGNGEQVSIKGAVQGNTVALAQQENSAEVERLKEALKVCGAEKEALHERLKEAQEVVKNAMEAVKVLATSNRQ